MQIAFYMRGQFRVLICKVFPKNTIRACEDGDF